MKVSSSSFFYFFFFFFFLVVTSATNQKYWVFRFCPSSSILKTTEHTKLRKADLFPSSGEGETHTLLSALERALRLALSKGIKK
jgi:hypothetical protein